jgi:hypothetical protein
MIPRCYSLFPLSRNPPCLSAISFLNSRLARRVHFKCANGESGAENNDPRRVHGTKVDAARPNFRTMGWSPQSELGEIPLYERKTQMRGGPKQRDIRGSGRRTRSRSDDERWCGVHRRRRIHKALAGNAGETEPTLDPQIYEVLLAEPTIGSKRNTNCSRNIAQSIFSSRKRCKEELPPSQERNSQK